MKVLLSLGLVSFTLQCGQKDFWAEKRAPERVEREITVYRTDKCECCKEWIKHLQKHGFSVKVAVTPDMSAIKKQYSIPKGLEACHTGVIGSMIVEGHVPANDIKRALNNRMEIYGISVPGMPVGSPGMEVGNEWEPFTVYSFDKKGGKAQLNSYAKISQ